MPLDTQLATIGSDFVGSASGITARRGMFVIGGVLYAAIARIDNPGTGFYQVWINKSEDFGATWAQAGPLIMTTLNPAFTGMTGATFAKNTYNGKIWGVFHCKLNGTAAGNRLVVASFDPAQFALGAGAWTPLSSQPTLTPPVFTGTPVQPEESIEITVSDAGAISLYFGWGNEDLLNIHGVPFANRRAQYVDYSAGAWGAQTDIPGQSGSLNSFLVSQAIVAASGRVHIFLPTSTRDALGNFELNTTFGYHITRRADGTWATLQQVAADMPYWGNPNMYAFGLGVAYSGGIVVPYVSGISNMPSGITNGVQNALHGDDSDNPTWAVKVVDASVMNGSIHNVMGSPTFQDVTASICDNGGGTLTMYFNSTTSTGAGPAFTPNGGDIRASVFAGGSWAPFTVYRTFNPGGGLLQPAGVFAATATSAMYFLLNSGSSAQANMMHFLGNPIEPAPPAVAVDVSLFFEGVLRLPIEGGEVKF